MGGKPLDKLDAVVPHREDILFTYVADRGFEVVEAGFKTRVRRV